MKNSFDLNAKDMLFLQTRGRKIIGVSANFGTFRECVAQFRQQMMGLEPKIWKTRSQRTAIWAAKGFSLWLFQPRKEQAVCASVMLKSLPSKRRS